MNPVVSSSEFEKIRERAHDIASTGNLMPSFPAADGQVKLSAAWLIEQAGFKRGYALRSVGTSSKHSLAIINRGGGTALDVVELAEAIKSRVREMFGVELAPEPIFVGFNE